MTPRAIVGVLLAIILLTNASAAAGDVVTDWNTAALKAIRVERTAPPRASRALAILHLAIYDAVNGISRTHEKYLVESTIPASTSKVAAASAAAHKALTTLFPARSESFNALHATTLAAIPDTPQKNHGLIWGELVADRILLLRASDNSDAFLAPKTGTGPGAWQPTPPALLPYLLPQWAIVAPFTMPAGLHFRPVGPPALNSERYADAYNEVKSLGAAVGSSRTPEQSEIALFWADGAGTETPPGHWNSIAQIVATNLGNTLEQNARLFAVMNAAMADGAICAWDAKYEFNLWRPVTAIRNGHLDGNDATTADPLWSSFIATPPFPDYVSGHSTFSGAASKVLALFFGTDQIAFTTGSDALPGVLRSFNSFSAAAAEAAVSRLYGGIHYQFANEDGMTSGVEIGEWAFLNNMQPKGNRSRR
jgi:hypothetical protein